MSLKLDQSFFYSANTLNLRRGRGAGLEHIFHLNPLPSFASARSNHWDDSNVAHFSMGYEGLGTGMMNECGGRARAEEPSVH